MEGKWQLTILLAAALLLHTSAAVAAAIPFYCKLNEFRCPSNIKQCIQSFELCNGIKDCADGSDENAAFCKSYGCNDTHPMSPFSYTTRERNSKCPSGNMCTKTTVDYRKPWLCTGGQKDCADGSDEDPRFCKTLARNCSLNAQGVFDYDLYAVADTCPSKKYCVEKGKLCDGKKDCPDGSDEWPRFCKKFTCPDQNYVSFRCKDGGCLKSKDQICSGVKDCGDGSDEDPAFCADYKCPRSRGNKCPDGRTCLSDSQICDGIKTCPDGCRSDEKSSFCRSFKCPGFKYKCKDGKQCVGEVRFDCLYQNDVGPLCKDKSDANNALCPSRAPDCNDTRNNIRCPGGVGCVAKFSLCDGKKDCKDGSDEGKFCKTYKCRDDRFGGQSSVLCKNTLACTLGTLCNGFADCTDGSDEDPTFCQAYKCPQGAQKCKSFPYQCVNDYELCDGRKHCINGGDEDKAFCRAFKCLDNSQKCPNDPHQCVDKGLLCDGNKDCSNGGDEDRSFCKAFKCLEGKQKCPNDPYECKDPFYLCNGYKECVSGGDEDPAFCKTYECPYFDQIKCPRSSTYQCVDKFSLCNGYNNCVDGSDEDPAFCKTYNCSVSEQKCPNSKTNRCISDYRLCNGIDDCGDGSDEDPAFCKSFKCPDGYRKCPKSLYQCIPEEAVCDGSVDCDDASDEDLALCRTYVCPRGTWRCPKDPICIPKTVRCDGERHCYDGADEDPKLCSNSTLLILDMYT